MIFSVDGESVELGHGTPPNHAMESLEVAVIPSVRIMSQWQDEGQTLAGSVFPGARSKVGAFEATGSEELRGLLSSVTFGGMIKWKVWALQSRQPCAQREHAVFNNAIRMLESASV